MPAGRPIVANELDLIYFNANQDFTDEKSMVDYVMLNLKRFLLEDFGVEPEGVKREFCLNGDTRKGSQGVRIDLFVRTKCGQNLAFEFKNPQKRNPYTELSRAFGQCLMYHQEFGKLLKDPVRIILVSNRFSKEAFEMLSKYSLPIEMICLNKSQMIYGELRKAN
jgi:hypothetical protein